VNTDYAYDNLSRLLSVLHKLGAQTIDGATYTVDAVGNRTSKLNHLNSVTETYAYDAIYQLTQVVQNSTTTTEAYSYDKVGNRLSTVADSGWTYNNSNQLTSRPGVSYTYDNNGNTLTKTDASGTTQYAWDYENRLSSVTLPDQSVVTFKYDPMGRRIQKASASGTTNYLYEGADIAEEVDATGTVLARYAMGPGIDQPLSMLRSGATSYYEADGLGSVTSLTDGTSSAVASYTYDSFGKLTSPEEGVTNASRYTGRNFDGETGLYYYRARYYDTTGRFLSEDPAGLVGGLNVYGYTEGNPVNFVDPSGLDTYLLVVGQSGLGAHNTGNLNMLAAQTYASQLQAAGHTPIITEVGTVSSLNGALTSNGLIDGGVAYFGHSSNWALFLGNLPPSGPYQPNLTSDNVGSLSGAQLGPDATITIYGCNAGYGDNSIAQLIADQLQRPVTAWAGALFFAGASCPVSSAGQKAPGKKPVRMCAENRRKPRRFLPRPRHNRPR
jgi:RHS repeat-associated protein